MGGADFMLFNTLLPVAFVMVWDRAKWKTPVKAPIFDAAGGITVGIPEGVAGFVPEVSLCW
jgi:ammonia channel protein AmtB